MISINDVYRTVQDMAQKAKHGTISPMEFNEFANMASIDVFNERIGSIRDYYRLGKAMPKTSSGMNKEVDQDLRPYLMPDQTVAVSAGIGVLPANCEFIDSILFGTVPVKWIPKDKEGSYLNSTIDVPTVDYPVYIDLSTQVKVYPTSITSVKMSFYKTPETVIWNYTLVGNRPVYNATGSVNYEWLPTMKLALVSRILGYVGIAIRDTELIQYANNEEATIA